MRLKKIDISLISILLVVVSWFWFHTNTHSWTKDHIESDVVVYYSYLPAAFICGDVTLQFRDSVPARCNGRYWYHRTENGGKVFKMTMGLSLLYLPFFFAGHLAAGMLHIVQDGYSAPYQVCLLLSSLLYLVLGLLFLRKTLLHFGTDRKIIALTILSIYFGTNLLSYSTLDALYSHVYSFSLISMLLYVTIRWYGQPRPWRSFLLGLLAGMITLIRPANVLVCLVPLLYDISGWKSLQARAVWLRSRWSALLIMALAFVLPLIPQLLYWKASTGKWIFDSYMHESFYFMHPHLLEGLFGFRKGWLIYTPMMALALAGIPLLVQRMKAFLWPVLLVTPLIVYITLSWWCWWYGGSFGQRPLVDLYAMLALPLTALFEYAWRRLVPRILVLLTVLFLVALNGFQTLQFKLGILHYDAMTFNTYKMIWGKPHRPEGWLETLDLPDYDRINQGLPEEYTETELHDGLFHVQYKNHNYLCDELNSRNVLTSSRYEALGWETFRFRHKGGNTVSIQGTDGRYASLHADKGIYADSPEVGPEQVFALVYLGGSKIALKADNGLYISVKEGQNNVLIADSPVIGPDETFRVFTVNSYQ